MGARRASRLKAGLAEDGGWEYLNGPFCDEWRESFQGYNPRRDHCSKVLSKKGPKGNVLPGLDVAS